MECSIKFEGSRTVFSLNMPAIPLKPKAGRRNSYTPTDVRTFRLPTKIWGIAIDDSKIQMKLLGKYFEFAGIQKDRIKVFGKNADEIMGFVDYVVNFMDENMGDPVLLIADENLDLTDEASKRITISGSQLVENIRSRLLPQSQKTQNKKNKQNMKIIISILAVALAGASATAATETEPGRELWWDPPKTCNKDYDKDDCVACKHECYDIADGKEEWCNEKFYDDDANLDYYAKEGDNKEGTSCGKYIKTSNKIDSKDKDAIKDMCTLYSECHKEICVDGEEDVYKGCKHYCDGEPCDHKSDSSKSSDSDDGPKSSCSDSMSSFKKCRKDCKGKKGSDRKECNTGCKCIRKKCKKRSCSSTCKKKNICYKY